MNRDELKKIPGVDRLLELPEVAEYSRVISPAVAAEVIRAELEAVRAEVSKGGECPAADLIVLRVRAALAGKSALFLREVINASGVIIHTNLGRAPLGREVIERLAVIGGGYSNLEYSLPRGKRGFRGDLQEELLVSLTGAEDATVVNNNAGAVFLILTQFAAGGEVIVSRGELIQIGGGFRIPSILEQSGAKLREVGTTNHTDMDDYRAVVGPATKMILKAHHSNFRMQGFVHTPADRELAALAHENGFLFVYDVGSGAMMDTEDYGIEHEPTVRDAIRADADIVCFSGDKLLGGPQAGIIVGKKDCVGPLKKHPLFRALRPDKLCLAALEQTLITYIKGEAHLKIPVMKMISMKPEAIRARAVKMIETAGLGEGVAKIIEGRSTIGGGSTPGETLPTFLVAVTPTGSPDELARRLRLGSTPVIARIIDDDVCFDLRTVPEERDGDLAAAVANSLS